jgi:FkbM family methyltransferase
VRLPLELILHSWGEQGTIPVQMTWAGQNFDVLTGITSLLLMKHVDKNRRVAWFANILGFGLLMNVLRVVVLTSPIPVGWNLENPLRLILYNPYAFIGPVFVIPALVLHLITFRKLLEATSRQAAIKWKLRVLLTRLGLWEALEYRRHWLSFRRGRTHEADFVFLKKFRGKPFFALDVGANEGQSALSIRVALPEAKVLSLEPNPALRSQLEMVARILKEGFEFRIVGCARANQIRDLYIPWVQGVALSQEASFDKSFLTDELTTQARIRGATGRVPNYISVEKMEVIPLDDLKLRPDFIKIDVQGLELEVLIGARRTLESCRPLVMVENGTNLGSVFDEMNSLGYFSFRFDPKADQLVPIRKGELTSLNVFFVHKERAEWLA